MQKPKNTKGKIWNVVFIGLLIFLVFSTGAKSWILEQMVSVGLFNAKITQGNESDKNPVLPFFSFSDEKGKVRSLTDLKGKVVFINFWATWCPPCLAEMPSLNSLYNKLKDHEGFVFLFINEDDDIAKAEKYLKRKAYDFPVNRRVGQAPSALFGGTLPTTVVMNKEGNIVLHHEGLGGFDTPAFIQQLKDLL